jgi:hypothetical protein
MLDSTKAGLDKHATLAISLLPHSDMQAGPLGMHDWVKVLHMSTTSSLHSVSLPCAFCPSHSFSGAL